MKSRKEIRYVSISFPVIRSCGVSCYLSSSLRPISLPFPGKPQKSQFQNWVSATTMPIHPSFLKPAGNRDIHSILHRSWPIALHLRCIRKEIRERSLLFTYFPKKDIIKSWVRRRPFIIFCW